MTSVMPDNTPPPPPASVQASSTGLAPGTANQNHHLQYMPQRRTPPPSSPTPTHPRPSSPLAATYTAIHIDAPLLNQHQTTLELYDTWALSLKPKRPSFIQNAMGFVKSFVSIITSDGSKVGIKVQDPAIQLRDEDAIMRKKLGNKLSIWTIMTKSSPDHVQLAEHVKMYKDEFRRTYGHHILLERFSEGETVLQFALLRKMTDIVDYLLEQKDIIHELVNLVYEGKRYWGEHSAHIAVVVYGDDPTMLKRLIKVGADVHTCRAVGSFFRQDGPLYMGETVLSFAACLNHYRIVSYLINEVGVDPNITDHLGNNVLHVLAWWGSYSPDPPRDIIRTRIVDDNGKHTIVTNEEEIWSTPPKVFFASSNRYGDITLAEDEEEESDEKKSAKPHVSQMYYYLAKMKFEVRSQQEFNNLDEADRELYLDDLMLKADDSLANSEGLTPLVVAVQNGKVEMVQALLKFRAQTQWEFGPIRQERHCLSEVDTFVEKETMNHVRGGLEVAIKNKDIKMINLPIFLKLLEAKWTLYGNRIFLSRFIVSFFYLVLLSVAIGLLPNNAQFYDKPDNVYRVDRPNRLNYFNFTVCEPVNNTVLEDLTVETPNCYRSPVPIIRFFVEVALILANLASVIREGVEISSSKAKYFSGFGSLENLFQWMNISVFVAVVVFRVLPYSWSDIVENTLLGAAAIFGWISLLYFSKGNRNLGPLVVIFFRIVTTDLIWFCALISVFVIGFSEALYLQIAPLADFARRTGGDSPNPGLNDWHWLGGGFVWGIRFVFGQNSYDDLRDTNVPTLTLILFMIAVLTITILLLNVFIAMLNNTFAMIQNDAEKQWRLTWASLIMEMDEKLIADFKHQQRHRKHDGAGLKLQPITRIGIPRAATIVKPQKRIDEDNSKAQDLAGSVADLTVGTSAKEKQEKPKWSGYIYDFLLEFKQGVDRPVRMIASFDENSPLYGETNVVAGKRRRIKNRRDE